MVIRKPYEDICVHFKDLAYTVNSLTATDRNGKKLYISFPFSAGMIYHSHISFSVSYDYGDT